MADDELSRCEWWKITYDSVYEEDGIQTISHEYDGPFFITLACAMAICRFRKRFSHNKNAKAIHLPDYVDEERQKAPGFDEDYWTKSYP